MIRILLAVLMMVSCSKSRTDDQSPPTLAQIAEVYRLHGDLADVPRCDSTTFYTHAAAMGVPNVPIYESPAGHLNRDKESCYPDDSASETSREMYLGDLHNIWTNRDLAALNRIIDYGTRYNWIAGLGPQNINDISYLIPIMSIMKAKLEMSDSLESALSGFEGHVLLSYLWLWVRVNGEIGPIGKEAISQLYQANPKEPMYSALWHRVSDGDFSETYSLLHDTKFFPTDMPTHETGSFGWGSCPDWLTYLMTMGIVNGK